MYSYRVTHAAAERLVQEQLTAFHNGANLYALELRVIALEVASSLVCYVEDDHEDVNPLLRHWEDSFEE